MRKLAAAAALSVAVGLIAAPATIAQTQPKAKTTVKVTSKVTNLPLDERVVALSGGKTRAR